MADHAKDVADFAQLPGSRGIYKSIVTTFLSAGYSRGRTVAQLSRARRRRLKLESWGSQDAARYAGRGARQALRGGIRISAIRETRFQNG